MAIGTETYRVRTDGAVIQLYNGATLIQSVTATPGIVRLLYDGTKVRVLNDGTEIITQPASAGQKLWPKISPYNTGVRIYDIKAGPAGLQPQIGSNLTTSTGAATSDPAILNSAITISSTGIISGAGGGAVTYTGLGGTALGQQPYLRLGGAYLQNSGGTTLTDSSVQNSAIALSAGGVLSGAGGGTVTIGGLTPNGVDDLADGTTYKRFQLVERTKLTGVATGATVGAIAGTNLYDSAAALLSDAAIKNSAITISAGGVMSGAGGGTVTYLGLGGTALGQQLYLRLGGAYLQNSAGTTLTDLSVQNSAIALSAAGVLSGAGGGTVTIGGLTPNGVDDLADGLTYKRYQLTERTKLTGVATGATVGAIAGTNLYDSVAALLSDAAIKNSAITISAAGVLSGAGGGTVNALNILNGPTEAGADKTSAQQILIEYATTNVNISASSTGVIDSAQFPITLAIPKVTKGGVSISQDNLMSYSITSPSTTVNTVSVNNTNGSTIKGQVTIPSTITGSGSFSLSMSYNGVSLGAFPVTVKVVNAAPPPSAAPAGTTSGQVSVSTAYLATTSGTPTIVATIAGLTVAAGKILKGQLTDTFITFGINRTGTCFGKWQYSVSGANSWTDMAAYTASNISAATDVDGYPTDIGSVTVNHQVTPAANTYDVRLVMYRGSGTGFGSVTLDPGPAYGSVV